MSSDLLRERIVALCTRLSWLGIGADIYALTISELAGLYAFLRRLAGE